MYVNKCSKCGRDFETKNPKRVICPNCLYPDRAGAAPTASSPEPEPHSSGSGGIRKQIVESGQVDAPEEGFRSPQQRSAGGFGSRDSRDSRDSNWSGGGGRPQGRYDNRGGVGGRPQGGYDRGGGGRPQGGYDRGGGGRPQGGYDRGGGGRPQGGYDRGGGGRPQGGYDRGGGGRPQGGYDRGGGGRPQGGYDRGGGGRPQGRFDNRGGGGRPQGGYDRGGGARPQGRFDNRGGGGRPQGRFDNRSGGGRPQGRFDNRGGGGRPVGGRPPMRRPTDAKLLVSKDQLIKIEDLYKPMLPLPNPDAHEVIGQQIDLEPRKVFFGINLIRQKIHLPKLPFPKRRLAVSVDQLQAVETLYEPLLPLPPIGCHKIIAKQLKMDEWRVHVAIGIIRKQMDLPRWNPDRDDAPEEFKKQRQEELAEKATEE